MSRTRSGALVKFQSPVGGYPVPETGLWLVEPKLRGCRLGALRLNGFWQLFTRRGRVTNHPWLVEALPWSLDGTFLDGEFVTGSGEADAWGVLSRNEAEPEGCWCIFDAVPRIPSGMPLEQRRVVLEGLFKAMGETPRIESLPAIWATGREAIQDAITVTREEDASGLTEGAVVKLGRSIYSPGGKKKTWRKFRWT